MNSTSQANQFALKAEELSKKGDYPGAAAAHFRAAELFLLAINDSRDAEAVKTLKLLFASHTRSGKDLQRRSSVGGGERQPTTLVRQPVSNGTGAGENPNLFTDSIPEAGPSRRGGGTSGGAVHLYSTTSSNSPTAATSPIAATEIGPSQSMLAASRQYFVGQGAGGSGSTVLTNPKIQSPSSSFNNLTLQQQQQQTQQSQPQQPHRSKDTSPSSSIGQSYLILDNNAREVLRTENEDLDPFDRFWEAVEGLVQKISGPVAFTTAPLGKSDELNRALIEQNLRPQQQNVPVPSSSSVQQSTFLNSYMLVKVEEYELESQQLRKTLDFLSNRVVELERTQQENTICVLPLFNLAMTFKNRSLNPQLYASIPPGSSGRSGTGTFLSGRASNKMSSSFNQGGKHQRPPPPQYPNLSTNQPQNLDYSSAIQIQTLQATVDSLQLDLFTASETIAAQKAKWEKLKESVKKKRESKNGGLLGLGSASEISLSTEHANTPENDNHPTNFFSSSSGPTQSAAAAKTSPPLPSGSSLYFSVNQSRFG